MALHNSTFLYLKPSAKMQTAMDVLRTASAAYARVIDENVPDGPDKTYLLRKHRENAMWANVAITREADGTPREGAEVS